MQLSLSMFYIIQSSRFSIAWSSISMESQLFIKTACVQMCQPNHKSNYGRWPTSKNQPLSLTSACQTCVSYWYRLLNLMFFVYEAEHKSVHERFYLFFPQHPTLLYNTFMDYRRFATSISPPPAGHYRKHISIYVNQFSNKNPIMNERSCNMWKTKKRFLAERWRRLT